MSEQSEPQDQSQVIAIVGMAGRFPGAANLEEFWQNLRQGKESISFFDEEELRASGVDEAQFRDPRYVPAKGYLKDAEWFDADFFGFNPREAEITDPQQRLFLEVAVEALENAGLDPRRFDGAIGVFGGVSFSTYLVFNLLPNTELMGLIGSTQASTRNRTDHLTTRVAYTLDLHGPAVTVQTACSTSLVGVHLACSSLLEGECDAALAGGVSVSVPRKGGYRYQEGGIMSPDGHCRAFDARAQGTLNGEGAGIVLLKRLEDAVAAGDHIHAVIRGSAINNDGSHKVGYTAPSEEGQALVIAEAQAVAGIKPETVTYIEAHGTATPLGDPIEVSALTQVFQRSTDKKRFCALGSVKTNVGHLDAAAGVAGLIKTVLALRHRELPPSLHFKEPNPSIQLDDGFFFVNDQLRSWEPQNGVPLRAGVSSFGIGGTNCHVVLEEAPPPAETGPSRDWQLILLSTRSAPSLESATERLVTALEEEREISLADVAYTLATGREQHRHRRALVCRDVDQCVEKLTSLDPGRVFAGVAEEGEGRTAAFLFPGQGSQHPGMGRELYRCEGVFRDSMDRCLKVLEEETGEDPRPVLWNPEREDELRETRWAQCALFAVEWSLAQLWMSWGVEPAAMIGHSIGEYVAACLAGVFDLEDAVRLVVARGRLMQDQPPGAMMMVPLSEEDTLAYLQRLDSEGRRLALAAINGPSLCVVSGEPEAVDELERELESSEVVGHRRLHVSHAFHSPMMDPILEDFRQRLGEVRLQPPRRPWVSNLTGRFITEAEATDPDYWVRQLRGSVRFSTGLSEILGDGSHTLLEVGPGRALRTLARWHPDKSPGQVVLSSLPPVDSNDPEEYHLRTTAGRLWVTGVPIDFKRYFCNERRLRVPLPTYPFERQRYWVDTVDATAVASGLRAPGARRPFEEWFYIPAWHRAPAPTSATQDDEKDGGWLIFADELGLAPRMAEKIRERGEPVAILHLGSADNGGDPHIIGPTAEAYHQLVDDLVKGGGLPGRILHLASLSSAAGNVDETETDKILERGFYSLLHLAQALGGAKLTRPIQIVVATHGVHEVTGNEVLCPERATVLGPARVIPQEIQQIACHTVDLDLPDVIGDDERDRLCDQLLAEATADDPVRSVAYRGLQRWVEDYQEVTLPSAAGELPALVRSEGVYLIVGGVGGIGLEIAHFLAQAGGARFVLIGRSPLPAREEWDDVLSSGRGTGRLGRRIRRIQDLEEVAEVLILTADVADQDEMSAAVARARNRFGRIDGVVHSAGVAGGGMIQLKTAEAAASVLRPKVQGTRVLVDVLADVSLDFLVLCSARGSVIGGFGQVDYCASNAYLDSFAHAASRTGETHVVAIDWPAWKEVGMLVDAAEKQRTKDDEQQEGEAVAHHLLDRHVRKSEQVSEFFTLFSPSTQWVLDEHRIIRSPVIPGTAYLEMARAAVEELVPGNVVELQDVFFLAPLVVRDDQQREVRTRLERTSDGFRFEISSKLSEEDDEEVAWRDFAVGNARLLDPTAAPTHDLQAWIDDCSDREIVLTDEDRTLEDLGPRWQSLRKVHLGDRELVAHFELPDEFTGDLETYKLHPALLDRVNGTGKEYLAGRGFYLPMSYRRLTIRSLLPKKFVAYSRFKTGAEDDRGETITFDVVITDESGRELVSIDDFSQKRVNDVASQMKALGGEEKGDHGGTGGQDAEGGGTVYDRALRQGISPAEGVAVLRRILVAHGLPQIVVSPTDLTAELAAQARSRIQERVAEEVESLGHGERAFHARPDLSNPYVEPRTDLEQSMVVVWENLLGIQPVGIHDNFFELGGDSVQAIQLVTRFGQEGLEVSPQQLFQHQTVAELAVAVGEDVGSPEEAEPLPLAPLQRWLVERDDAALALAARIQAGQMNELHVLTQAVETVAEHHQALRLRLVEQGEAGWRQSWADAVGAVPVRAVELSADTAVAEQRLAELRSELAAELDAKTGPVLAVALLTRDGQDSELLLVVHELAGDAASLGTLIEDLTSAYGQIAAGNKPLLRRRAAAYPDWMAVLRRRAEEIDPDSAPETRRNGFPEVSLPVESPAADAISETMACAAVALGDEETANLLAVARKHRVSVEELLLVALTDSLSQETAQGNMTFEMERSTRGGRWGDLDLQRTVGPLQHLFPLAPPVQAFDLADQQLWRRIKEDLRPMLEEGLDYSLVHAFHQAEGEERQKLTPAALRLAYLEDLGDVPWVDLRWEIVDHGRIPRPMVRAFHFGGVLHLHWLYDPARYQDQTVNRWLEKVLEVLRSLIRVGHQGQEVDLVPSDFPLANLDEESLGRFSDLLQKLDNSEGA